MLELIELLFPEHPASTRSSNTNNIIEIFDDMFGRPIIIFNQFNSEVADIRYINSDLLKFYPLRLDITCLIH